jgi:hypothetical protein
VLIEADPMAFFLMDHSRPYPMVVMRLGKVRPARGAGSPGAGWRRAAPKSLVAARPAER